MKILKRTPIKDLKLKYKKNRYALLDKKILDTSKKNEATEKD
jgi:hypothetical protein